VLTTILFAVVFLLPSCVDRKEEIVKTTEESPQETVTPSDPNLIVLEDQSGASLTLDLRGRLDAFLSAGTTDEFSVPVRLRFQGGEADANFRKSTEMGPDEEDYWEFDKEKGQFEVGWAIAFLRSLAEADRLFLEIKFSDQDRKALVFGLNETQRGTVLTKLEENRIRIDNEMRALKLGPYAPKETQPENPDHLKVEIDDEALFVLYDEFIILLSKLSNGNVFPTPTPRDQEAMALKNDPIRPITNAFSYYAEAYPKAMAVGEQMALDAGFESAAQWRAIGDRLQMGMAMIGLEQVSPGFIDQHLNVTAKTLATYSEDTRKYNDVIKAFSKEEINWFTENRPRFQRAITGK